MAIANRHHIPGQVWHITHRCHKKEFLLKFAKDRQEPQGGQVSTPDKNRNNESTGVKS